MLDGLREMPGCLSDHVAEAPSDHDALWITAVWDTHESHAASLTLDRVQQAMTRGRPLIAGFGVRQERRRSESMGPEGQPL